MEIKIKRLYLKPKSTIGILTYNDITNYSCEDRDRGLFQSDTLDYIERVKIPKQTAIPKGRYEVIVSMSTRFKKLLPELLNVPGFSGIRIHTGNTTEDTEGCILPGLKHDTVNVIDSVKAATPLFAAINAALNKNEKVFITIE